MMIFIFFNLLSLPAEMMVTTVTTHAISPSEVVRKSLLISYRFTHNFFNVSDNVVYASRPVISTNHRFPLQSVPVLSAEVVVVSNPTVFVVFLQSFVYLLQICLPV